MPRPFLTQFCIFRPRHSRRTVAYSRQTFLWTICRSVRTCIGRSVCAVHCSKLADRIRMPFGIIGRTGPGMRQVVGFGDRSTGRGTFGAHHCNQWGLYSVCVRQRRDAALFPNYFGQTCCLRRCMNGLYTEFEVCSQIHSRDILRVPKCEK